MLAAVGTGFLSFGLRVHLTDADIAAWIGGGALSSADAGTNPAP